MRLESKGGGIDVGERALSGGGFTRRDGKSIDAIALADDFLELIQMHPHLILASRNLGRICTALHDRRHDDGVPAARARPC